MKKLVSVVLLALVAFSSVNACVKKKKSTAEEQLPPLTVLVMDTTQALLPGAQVKIGKTTLTASFDGRVVVKPEVLGNNRSLAVSCEGYKEQNVEVRDVRTLVVKLTPKPGKKGKSDDSHYVFATRSGAHYEKATVMMATADYAMDAGIVMEEEVESAMTTTLGAVKNNNVSAGRLTAGEVNDFAKWSFWPNVIDSTHRKFVSEWQIAPRHRYTVQVVNKNGYPIASRPVSLLDNAGNTIFQAVTDNTGKAELWYQLIGTQCGKHLDFKVRVDDQTQIAKQWIEGGNTFVLDEPCESSESVDVMFVFDATGSMGDELRYLQEEMKDVIARASDATGGFTIRTGAVVYRDHCDEYLTRISRLTEDIKTTQAFIDKQSANGGGDYEEAVPEALMAALNSAGWDESARARIAFLVLDAPCHNDSATLALLHEQILNAAALGVRVVPVVCSGLRESGEYLLRAMALATNGTSFFLTDDSGIGHKHIKPTTDSLNVEHLNDMLVRTIVEFSYMPDCAGHWHEEEISQIQEQFVPSPFKAEDVANDPSIPHGPTTLYLMDVSGKLIRVFEGSLEEMSDSQLSAQHIYLSTGVYFVMAFYEGQWHTKKLLVH